MSKKKSIKKDKAKKRDLFSMMMDQSALFRDMVARFQDAIGFPTAPPATPASDALVARETAPKPKTTTKRRKMTKKAVAKSVTAKSEKPAAPKKAASRKKTTTASKKAPTKAPARRAAARRSPAK